MTTAPICSRCGGYHEARECLIQDVVCEIEGHLRVHGPTSVEALQRHLEENLGFPRGVVLDACARWVGANDA